MVDQISEKLEPAQRLDATIEANVLLQIEKLRTYPCVQSAEQAGELQIHGWVYDFRCGLVKAYDSEMGLFIEEKLEWEWIFSFSGYARKWKYPLVRSVSSVTLCW